MQLRSGSWFFHPPNGGSGSFFYQLCISVSVSAGPEEEEEKEEEKKTNGSVHKMCSQLMLLL